MTEPLRVVLDTNLFPAAYWNRRSASWRIIRACLDGRLRAYVTDAVRDEVLLIMRNIRPSREFMDGVEEFLRTATAVAASPDPVPSVDDPADAKFLRCALASGADYLVTSDVHLLRVGEFGRTSVIKPGLFARLAGI